MKRSLIFAALGVAALVGSGCAKVLTAQDLMGTWDGKVVVSDDELKKELKMMGKTDKDLPEARKQAESAKIPMELKKDMTFTLGQGMGQVEGSWKFEKENVTLTIEKAGGMKVEDLVKQAPMLKDSLKPMTWGVEKDGKTINGSMSNPMTQSSVNFKFTKPSTK